MSSPAQAGAGTRPSECRSRRVRRRRPRRRPGRRRCPARGPSSIDVVRGGDDVRVVLDDEHGVALVAQPVSRAFMPADVARVQPDVGSSNTYMTSTSDDPRWRTILTRWDSPPDSVEVSRSRVR